MHWTTWVVPTVLMVTWASTSAPKANAQELQDEDVLNVLVVFQYTYQNNRKITSSRLKIIRTLKKLELYEKFTNVQINFGKLEENHPDEVLEVICDKLVRGRNVAMIYISDFNYSPNNNAAAKYVIEMASSLGMPVIAWLGDDSGLIQPSPENNVLQVTVSIAKQCRAMLSILKRYNWHAFSIVTGTLGGNKHFINVLRDMVEDSSNSYSFDILSVIKITAPVPSVIRRELERLKASDTRVILFYASVDEAQAIFEIATDLELTHKEYVWIASNSVVGAEENTLDSSYPHGLFALKHIDYTETEGVDPIFTEYHSGKVQGRAAILALDALVYGVNDLYTATKNGTNTVRSFMRPPNNCSDLDIPEWKDGLLITEYVKKTRKDGVRIFEDDGTLANVELKVKNLNRDKKWETIGDWKLDENGRDVLKISDITWPGESRTPPTGMPSTYKMRVVTLEEKPYVVYSDPDPRTGTCPPQSTLCRIAPLNDTRLATNATTNSSLYQCCSGLCIDLLKMLSEEISFQYDLFQVEDKKWGAYVKETGEWNGLIRTIMDGKADMVMTSLKITPERNQQIDFSVPFLETGITILVAVRDGVISPTAFLEPFDIVSWMFILVVCMHIVALTIWIFEWISPNAFDLKTTPPPGSQTNWRWLNG